MTISTFADTNRAGNVGTSISHMVIIIYVHNTTIVCYSKKQNIVEASTFFSEFVALCVFK